MQKTFQRRNSSAISGVSTKTVIFTVYSCSDRCLRILMKKRYSDAIIAGVKAGDFPPLAVDYGYRDSKNFWYHRHRRMRAELLPIREASLESVRYAADRADDKVKFTDDALKTILNVPRVFLPLVLKGCVEWARENGVELVTAEHMKIINDKRAAEKAAKK